MSVLDRAALEASPLADLHAIASELGIDGFRRLRKAQLIDAILAQGGDEDGASAPAADDAEEAEAEEAAAAAADEAADDEPGDPDDEDDDAPRTRSRGGRGRRGRGRSRGRTPAPDPADEDDDGPADEERRGEGTVELLGNGSAFLRVAPPDPSDDDVYVSAAQVRRCELVSGDVVAGPVRPPRRSERFASLIRVETINGAPAEAVAEGTRFDDLPAAFPSERLALGGDDLTVKAIEWLTPFGKGSRVTIVGAARAGKTEALRRLARALAERDDVEVSVVLAGTRPEETSDWDAAGLTPASVTHFGMPSDAQAQAVEHAIEQGRRVAARGGDAVVVVDTLEWLAPAAARRALAAARNIVDGGSLTVIATAPAPLGGETTVIALNATLTSMRRFPALDLTVGGTLRPELLVGEAGAEAIAKARAEAVE